MQITILASGSRGDVQPYVALGAALQRAGHTIRLVTTANFRSLAEQSGLAVTPIGGDAEAAAHTRMAALAEQGNLLKILSSTGQGAEQIATLGAQAGLEASQGADLIVAGLSGLTAGLALAERVGARFLPAYLMPLTPTRAFASVVAPLAQLPAGLNRLSHRLTQQMLWQMFRAADTRARQAVLGLPPAPRGGPPELWRGPTLYGFSAHVIPRPPDWGDDTHITGYWFLDAPEGWRPPEALERFLESGPPPVYIGFGSMPSSSPEATARLAIEALARSGQRGVLMAGWGGMRPSDLPEHVYLGESLPHSWLLPRMAAVVHHGGAGTTAAALRAGVPSIVTPFFGDQPFWGRRVAALGAGPQPIPRRQLTPARLAQAIGQALGDPDIRRRAAELGQRISAERGADAAAALIAQT